MIKDSNIKSKLLEAMSSLEAEKIINEWEVWTKRKAPQVKVRTFSNYRTDKNDTFYQNISTVYYLLTFIEVLLTFIYQQLHKKSTEMCDFI